MPIRFPYPGIRFRQVDGSDLVTFPLEESLAEERVGQRGRSSPNL